jgi:hypothetical protein
MIKKVLFSTLFILFCVIVLALSIRGNLGNPKSSDLTQTHWTDEGPFELSPERGRFALIYSVAEDKSFIFSDNIAKFASPDVAFSKGKFVSLFAPGVSFIASAGYFIGRFFGASQIGSFAIISLFAIFNAILLKSVATKLGANNTASKIASLVFLFGTPAFAYAVSLYQHHISTFLILLSLYALIKFKSIWSLGLIWFLCALSVVIDYPNLFLMFPVGIFALGRIFQFKKIKGKLRFNFKILGIITFITMAIPLSFFLWFNQVSYGNPYQLSGTLKTVKEISNPLMKTNDSDFGGEKTSKTAIEFFKSRPMLHGFYIHFISPDRGVINYTPVLLVSILGIIFAYKRQVPFTSLLLAVVLANILLYSMWGDPWGGWAFGSRYLIPSYAILAIFIALILTHLRKNIPFLIIFLLLSSYSIAINSMGAITSSKNPPKVEAQALEKITHRVEKYTYFRNFEILDNNRSKSFFFQILGSKYLTAWQYYFILTSLIIFVVSILLVYIKVASFEEKKYVK